MARLQKALGVLVAGRAVSGEDVEDVIGHVLTLLLLNRLTLSFLGHVYDFVKDLYLRKRPQWPSVRNELALIRGLLPLCRCSIRQTVRSSCYMFDASLEGYAMVEGFFDRIVLENVVRHQER